MGKTTFPVRTFLVVLLLIGSSLTFLTATTKHSAEILIAESVTNVSCHGKNDGAINTTITGGTGNYTISWSSGQAAEDIPNLTAGSYTITVTDENGSETKTIQVSQPDPLAMGIPISNPVSCNRGSDGTVTAGAVSGGNGEYQYSLDGTNFSSSNSFSGLTAGTFTITVKDANGCTDTETAIVSEPATLTMASPSTTPISCNGGSNGTVTAGAVSGGNEGYQYSIDGTNYSSSNSFSGLTSGTYTLTVKDSKGCTDTEIATVSEPGILTMVAPTATPVSCNGGNNGTVTAGAVSGGNGDYQYKLNAGTYGTFNTFSNLAAGTYSITVKDSKNCETTQSVTVNEPAILSATVSSTDANCFGATNGTITITNPSGGNGSYQYTINNGTTWQDSGNFAGLGQGAFQVLIRDKSYTTCSVVLNPNLIISQPAKLGGTVGSTNLTCANTNDGSITIINPSGGNGTYEYSINSGSTWQTSAVFSGLRNGTYPVSIRDKANPGCVIILDSHYEITKPFELSADVSSQKVTCNAASDGTIIISNPSGGYGNYEYSLDGTTWQTNGEFAGLSNGSYSVFIRDSENKNCSVQLKSALEITQPQTLSSSIVSKVNVLCNGLATGEITATAQGGTAPYTFSWGSLGPGEKKTNLSAGIYTVTVTDANGCSTAPLEVEITQPATFIQITSTKTTSGCFQQNNGTAIVEASGGTGAYRYLWSNGQTTKTATGLAPGTHSVTITDANGCSKSTNVTVSTPTHLQITGFLTTETTSWGSATGTATAQVSGGSPAYTFKWSGAGSSSQTGQTARNLPAGKYTVTVTDSNGCTATKEVLIIDTLAAEIIPTSVCKTQGDITRTSTFSVENRTAKGGTGPYTYQWNFGTGATPATATGPGPHEVKYPTIGEKTISVKVTDSKGLTLTKTIIQYVGGCFVADCGSNDLGVDNYFIGDSTGKLVTTTNCADAAQKYLYIILPTMAERYSLYIEYIYSVRNLQTGATQNFREFGCFYPKTHIPDVAQTIPINYTCGDIVKVEGIYLTFSNNIQWGCGEGPKPKCYSTNNEASVRSPLYAVAFPNQLLCNGSSDGRITARASGGTAPYLYSLNNAAYGTANEFANLSAGTYTVKVKDAAGAIFTVQTEITQPINPLVLQASSKTSVTCFGGSDGTATVQASGGTPNSTGDPYIYVWQNGQTTATATNLSAGKHNVRVIDANGCEVSLVVNIEQPAQLQALAGPDQVLECGTTSTSLQADFNYTPPPGGEVRKGLWTIVNGPAGGSFIDATNPTTIFNGAQGTYTLRWTVPCGASDDVKISITSCSTIDFDGINDHIDFSNNFNLPANFTLEAWVKQDPTKSAGIKTILSKRNGANLSQGGYDLIVENNIPKFRWNANSLVSKYPIGTDRWYHIAVIKGGVNEGLYIDGIIVNEPGTAPGSPTALENSFIIGAIYNSSTPVTPEKYFHGWIEEVRIWNTALNLEQLHFMMNQKLQNNGGKVKGLEIPLNVPGNLTWDKLSGYYPLGVTQSGYTIGEIAGSPTGKLINITTTQQRTAPLPYISDRTGQWFADATWLRPQVWDPPQSLGVDGTTLIKWNIVRISHNINSGGKDIRVLGLLSKSGKLTIVNPNSTANELNPGQSLTITHYLQLNGNIDLVGESQLIQTDIGDSVSNQTIVSVLDESSTGYIERDQQGTANSYNYNYWSSPVSLQGATNNSTYTIGSVMFDGTNSAATTHPNLSFGAWHEFADGPLSTPRKISNYWLWKFRGTANVYSEWKFIGSTGTLSAGEGYTMKGTSGYADIEDRQNYVFKGKPNNGTIPLNIQQNQNYLLGNPYPSALDINKFILDNLNSADVAGGTNTKNVFNGAVYFWNHFAGGNTHILLEYIGGYATRNLIDGVPAISNDYRVNANDAKGSKVPGQFIPVAQGFFVNSVIDPEVAGDMTVAGGDVLFKNSQRAFVRESSGNTGNSVFLRPEVPIKQSAEIDNRSKIRLDFKSPMGYYRQILVGVDAHASNGFDLGYDALMNDYNVEDMYWIIGGREFVIQGVSNFGLTQKFPLGLRINEEGEIMIKINELKNVGDEVNIFLKDKVNDTYYDLRKSEAKINIGKGEITDRFEIVFKKDKVFSPDPGDETDPTVIPGEVTNPGEGTDPDPKESPDKILPPGTIDVIFAEDDHQLRVLNPDEMNIQQVEIFNLLGQKIESFKADSNQKQLNFPVQEHPSALYVVKVFAEEGMVSKNILLMK